MSATFFIQRLQTFFLFSPRFLRFHLNVYYIYVSNIALTYTMQPKTNILDSLNCRAPSESGGGVTNFPFYIKRTLAANGIACRLHI